MKIKEIMQEIDESKPNGWSIGIIAHMSLLQLLQSGMSGYLFVTAALLFSLLLLVLFSMPHAKKVEAKLFAVKNLILRRLVVVLVRGMAFVCAVSAGIGRLKYYA